MWWLQKLETNSRYANGQPQVPYPDSLQNLRHVKVKERYQVKISNGFENLEILDDNVGINGFCVRSGENIVAYLFKARTVEPE
jgi:hypothetical protein